MYTKVVRSVPFEANAPGAIRGRSHFREPVKLKREVAIRDEIPKLTALLEFYADIESEIYPQGSGHMPGYLANITGGMENMRQALEGIERHWPQMDNATLECIASDTLQIAAGWHALHAYIMARLNSRGQ